MISELLSPSVILYHVEPNIFPVYPDRETIHHYDQNVAFYNRLMWGYSISEFSNFILTALESKPSGWILDARCGSLAFTARTYTRYSKRPVVMLDQSIQTLRIAKSRLLKLCKEVPSNVTFLQGDILQLPFRPLSFSTVISLSVLHVIEDAKAMISELWKVRTGDGELSLKFSKGPINRRCVSTILT